MATLLKQSTAVDIKIGPFVDETDGKTAETALTITQPDIRLAKNGGAWAQKNAAQTLSHEEAGWYEVSLDTTDTDTLGILIVAIHESGALPVWREFMVVPANVYDSLVGGSDKLDVNVEEWNATSVPAEHTAGYPVVTVKDGTGTGELDTASGVVLAKDHTGANLATAAALDAVDNFVDTEIADIQARLPAALTAGGNIKADVLAISGDATAADNLEAEYDGTGYKSYLRRSTAQAGAAGSITLDAGASATDSLYVGQALVILSGTGAGQTRLITAYNGTTKVATISPNWTTNPDVTSVFVIVPWARVDLALWLGTAPNALSSGRVDSEVGAYASGQTPLQPTVAGRTLDVSAGGEAGVDWANVGTPGSTVNLSATTVGTAAALTTNNDKTGYALSAAGVQAIWDALTSALTTVGSIGKRLADYITGDAFVRLGAPAGASIAADLVTIDNLVDDLESRLTAQRATNLDNLDRAISAVLTTAMTEAYAADGVAPTPAQALFLILQRLTEFSISGTTITIKKLDGSTTAATLTLDDATTPTSSTRAT